jgi:hypothetical protein
MRQSDTPMATFLILAPFGSFALLMLVASATTSLFVAAALSLGIVVWDVARGGSVKMLAAGTTLLFAAIGCYVTLIDGNWSRTTLHLAVDLGVLAIALLSLAIRSPFTLQYAREQVDAETTKLPGFLAANYVITWAWTFAFVLMLLADMLVIFVPGLPLWIGFAIAFAARNAALYFTRWYPQYRRAKHAAEQTASLKS